MNGEVDELEMIAPISSPLGDMGRHGSHAFSGRFNYISNRSTQVGDS
jgi:hypothetical protein